jgi:hypothetical protein
MQVAQTGTPAPSSAAGAMKYFSAAAVVARAHRICATSRITARVMLL